MDSVWQNRFFNQIGRGETKFRSRPTNAFGAGAVVTLPLGVPPPKFRQASQSAAASPIDHEQPPVGGDDPYAAAARLQGGPTDEVRFPVAAAVISAGKLISNSPIRYLCGMT